MSRLPATLSGVINAGAELTRPYGTELAEGYFPIVQCHPKQSVEIVKSDATSITLRNVTAGRTGLYLIVFVNQETARQMAAVKTLLEPLADRWRIRRDAKAKETNGTK